MLAAERVGRHELGPKEAHAVDGQGGRSRGVRAACYVAALLVFAQVYFIARTHHPLGALFLLG